MSHTLFRHIDVAHRQWGSLLRPGDCAIDATCGNGKDSLVLARLTEGNLLCIDIQKEAIERTRLLLYGQLTNNQLDRVIFRCHSHTSLPHLLPTRPKLIVYNLGYLPGGDKTVTTLAETTILSLKAGLPYLLPGGVLTVTCYGGHPEGRRERERVFDFIDSLSTTYYSTYLYSGYTTYRNVATKPVTIFLIKNKFD
ncbi:MAG: class I SAM-dependent methyltransferase [Simkaniaceae bacterium]|nr:class I SAM-dependent methyltransferase [Simkaniaceae bacterium]